MRLATCLSCHTITKLSDFEGANPEHDVVLQDWIDRHLHAVPVDEIPGPLHPGAQIAVVDMPDITRSPKFLAMPIEDQERALERIAGVAVYNLQSELQRQTQQVFEYRDDLRDEAAEVLPPSPLAELPGARAATTTADDSKRVGRTKVPKKLQKYLCHFCPYSSTIMVELRRRKGAYAMKTIAVRLDGLLVEDSVRHPQRRPDPRRRAVRADAVPAAAPGGSSSCPPRPRRSRSETIRGWLRRYQIPMTDIIRLSRRPRLARGGPDPHRRRRPLDGARAVRRVELLRRPSTWPPTASRRSPSPTPTR